jgi:adenylate kinase
MRKIIFLGGIHGTGKGYVSERLCKILPLEYLSASELIKWKEINQDAQNKTVENIPDTQKLLMKALQATCEDNRSYLLDGHYCLLNNEQSPTKVPFKVFENINPIALLLTLTEPEIIVKRLLERDNKLYNRTVIENMQNLEIEYVKEISVKLRVPMFIADPLEIEDLANKIRILI